ncbi:MAG: hypothetical protein WAM02_11090 [Candidatus Cybelea sp.]
MKSNQAKYRISTMCRTLGVSTSGYYAWLLPAPSRRKQRDIVLGDRIEVIHRRSRNTYGRPRIKAELKDPRGHTVHVPSLGAGCYHENTEP